MSDVVSLFQSEQFLGHFKNVETSSKLPPKNPTNSVDMETRYRDD